MVFNQTCSGCSNVLGFDLHVCIPFLRFSDVVDMFHIFVDMFQLFVDDILMVFKWYSKFFLLMFGCVSDSSQ